MVLNVHRNPTVMRDGEMGAGPELTSEGVWRWGEKAVIYLSLHCHHQNLKVGSDESHFNVS